MDALKIYDNFLTPSDYQNSSMQTKNTFTELTRDYLSAMCKNVAYGQSPVYVTTGLMTLNAQKNSFENVTSNELLMPCGQRTCFLQPSTLLGQTIEDNYKSWQCSSEMCSGKNIVQWQIFLKTSISIHDMSLFAYSAKALQNSIKTQTVDSNYYKTI